MAHLKKHLVIGFSVLSCAASGCGKRRTEAAPTMTADRVVLQQTAQPAAAPEPSSEQYDHIVDNSFEPSRDKPLSTFAVDVDTASYSNVRRFLLNEKRLPPADAVRIEELVNYFPYAPMAAAADDGDRAHTLGVATDIGPCPWQPEHLLARVRVGAPPAVGRTKPRNMVFLVDVSGSMEDANKLPLLRTSLEKLTETLGARDRVAMVVYAGAAGVVLPPTRGDRHEDIIDALDELSAGGSTNGAGGILEAYRLARESFVDDGDNRVILATDGDFNVGVSSQGELVGLIEQQKQSGVFLTVLGFGGGNYNDSGLEALADHGNGNYAYIDSQAEADKVLVEGGGANLVTVARDVKIQVEFNPRAVSRYRLIGYENRALRDEAFVDDAVDGGEVGPGHVVTALYELVPAGRDAGDGIALRYQEPRELAEPADGSELFTVKVRYQAPEIDAKGGSREIVRRASNIGESFDAMPSDFRFAASVAAFGMLLRDSPHKGSATLDAVSRWAEAAVGDDAHRSELVDLIGAARKLAR